MSDWQQFIAALANSLAWPVSAVLIALLIRKPIFNLIERITEMSGFGVSAKFDHRLAKTAEAVVTSQQGKALSAPAVSDALMELAERSPRTAILEGWLSLESHLKTMLAAKGNRDASLKTRSPGILLEMAVKEGLISRDTYDSLNGLRVLRNLAVHGKAEDLTFEKAKEFLVLADAMEMVLKRSSKP